MRHDLLIFALSVLLPGAAFAAGEPQVDFRNFVYLPSCADFESQEATVPVRVTDGLFEGKPGTAARPNELIPYETVFVGDPAMPLTSDEIEFCRQLAREV